MPTTREIEPELVPCCPSRKYGIRVVVYNPLAHISCQFPTVHTAYDRDRSAVVDSTLLPQWVRCIPPVTSQKATSRLLSSSKALRYGPFVFQPPYRDCTEVVPVSFNT
jgi:hypothetical protein